MQNTTVHPHARGENRFITAATASLGAAPPEVINKSFWNDVYIAKLIRGLWMDLCVGSVPSTQTSNTEMDVVFANTGGHVMEGTPLVFIITWTGTVAKLVVTPNWRYL